MAKADATVEELVSQIERGEIRLPEMQRRYVWRSTRVRDLMDSLYRGYPSGAILLWQTDEAVPLQDFAVQQTTNPYHSTKLLLDGQQRLTSLSAVLRGEPVQVRGRVKPIELLFNLEHPEELAFVTEVDEDADEDAMDDEADSSEDELQKRFDRMTFVVGTKKLAQLPHWVSVSEVLKTTSDTPFLRRAGIKDFDDPRHDRYTTRLARLRDIRKYTYRLDILERTLSYDEVTEIFVRVNSLGAKLRSSDLALAQITAKWRNSLKTFQHFQSECARSGFDLDLGILLKNMMAIGTGQSRFRTAGNLSEAQLKVAWKQSCEGMDFALNFMKSNTAIDSPALLSSPFLIVALSFYGHHNNYELDNNEAQHLGYWAMLANAKGRYSRGSSETLLDQDLTIIKQGGGPGELQSRLIQQVGRFSIEAEELEGRNQRSALFKTMFMAFKRAGAKDWRSNLAIALNHSGARHKLQFHHIFPKALLKGRYTDREINDIANLSFIGGKTNRGISDKAPDKYLLDLLKKNGKATFETQCIPLEPELLTTEHYRDFLAKRRALIAERLNEYLEILKVEGPSHKV
jgi:hypothetical protein